MFNFAKYFFCEVIFLERTFYELLTEIAYGLVVKEETYNKNRDNEFGYFQQPELISAIQKFALMMLKMNILDEKSIPIAPKNETDALLNYFSLPLEEWPPTANENFYFHYGFDAEDFLVYMYKDNTMFYTTDWCRELADECKKYNQNTMQNMVFQEMFNTEPHQYVFLRKFIVENLLIGLKENRDFLKMGKDIGLDNTFLKNFIDLAYEPFSSNVIGQCGYCGWTVTKDRIKLRCIDYRCSGETDGFLKMTKLAIANDFEDAKAPVLRLNAGVMKYICLPGKDELAIQKFCDPEHSKTELWPDKDRYDLKIEIAGEILAVDVKSFRHPYSLKYNIEQKGIFNKLYPNEKPFLIIPNDRLRKNGYIDIVKQALPVSKEITCISMKEFEHMIKRKEAKKDDR